MEFRILTKNDKIMIDDVMNHYLNWHLNAKLPIFDYKVVENNYNFVTKTFFNNNNDILLSGGIKSNNIEWLAVTTKMNYWTKNKNFLNCWYWKFLYSRNKSFKNTGYIVDKLAEPILKHYEAENYWKFFKATKFHSKLLNNKHNIIDKNYNKIFNFETYDSKIELVCHTPDEKSNNLFSIFLPDIWRSGISLVVMSHTKKNV